MKTMLKMLTLAMLIIAIGSINTLWTQDVKEKTDAKADDEKNSSTSKTTEFGLDLDFWMPDERYNDSEDDKTKISKSILTHLNLRAAYYITERLKLGLSIGADTVYTKEDDSITDGSSKNYFIGNISDIWITGKLKAVKAENLDLTLGLGGRIPMGSIYKQKVEQQDGNKDYYLFTGYRDGAGKALTEMDFHFKAFDMTIGAILNGEFVFRTTDNSNEAIASIYPYITPIDMIKIACGFEIKESLRNGNNSNKSYTGTYTNNSEYIALNPKVWVKPLGSDELEAYLSYKHFIEAEGKFSPRNIPKSFQVSLGATYKMSLF